MEFIDTEEKLAVAAEKWHTHKLLGIDIECENNLHHYGAFISIIQIASEKECWLVDILALPNIKPLLEVLCDPTIEKIFHDVDFDFRILNHQFECKPRHIFDTQIAALFLGEKEIGLGALLEKYLDQKKVCKFQMADWTKRPLSREMLEYACKDTLPLIELRKLLREKLRENGRLAWVEEELQVIETKPWEYHQGTYEDVKGFSHITPEQRGVLKELYLLRDSLAQKVNRPVHFIFTNKQMLQFAQHAPDWKNLRGVHPIVRTWANHLAQAVQRGKAHPLEIASHVRPKFTVKQKEFFQKLQEKREALAATLGLQRHIILSVEQMQRLAVTGKYDSLKEWQKKLLIA